MLLSPSSRQRLPQLLSHISRLGFRLLASRLAATKRIGHLRPLDLGIQRNEQFGQWCIPGRGRRPPQPACRDGVEPVDVAAVLDDAYAAPAWSFP